MKYYKIISIEPESDRMDRLISGVVYIENLKLNTQAYLVYVDDELEPSYGKMMRTSRVVDIERKDGEIKFETLNNVYTLRELAT
jgi:hypothetical protein